MCTFALVLALATTGCHVVATTATTTIATKVTEHFIDLIADVVDSNREFDETWNRLRREHDEMEARYQHELQLREGYNCPSLEACR